MRASGAEFSVAQGVYVETASGWFSDRTVRYLASGRPALVQDTGFSRTLPVGEGLLGIPDAGRGGAAGAASWSTTTPATGAPRAQLAERYFAPERALEPLLDRQRGGAVRIVVAGMVAGVPGQGGATWAVLQYVLGLRRLGHGVLLVEQVDRLRACRVPVRCDQPPVRPGGGAGRARQRPHRRRIAGPICGADLLLNLSGSLTDEDLLERVDRRVYVDLDPAFTQLWHAAEGIDLGFDRHHAFVTVGCAIGARRLHGSRLRRCAGSPPRSRWCSNTGAGPNAPATARPPPSATGAATARSATTASTTASAPTRCASC